MSRKILVALVAGIVLALGLGCIAMAAPPDSDSNSFYFTVKVNKYIEAGMIAEAQMNPYPNFAVDGPEFAGHPYPYRFYHAAYANCPFTISITGDNPAGDGVPIFAKAEEGMNTGGRYRTTEPKVYDRLSTMWELWVSINTYQNWNPSVWAGNRYASEIGSTAVQVEDPVGSPIEFYKNSAFESSLIYSFLEEPHNGDIQVQFRPHVDGPDADEEGDLGRITGGQRGPQDWWDSADYGIYEAYITVTYTAI
jgi:hypothetical protein